MIKGAWRNLATTMAGLFLLGACVPQAAGYDDVKNLTSARLGETVHWNEQHGRPSQADTDRLLEAPLTADSAVRVALLNNQRLQADFEKLGIARGQWVSALRLPNPEVGVALHYGATERAEIDLDATLSLSQLLFLAWRNGASEAQLDAATIEVASSAVDLAYATRSAFFDYQAAAQRLELQRTILESLQASAEMAEQLHRAGNITDLQRASERALYEEARISYSQVEAKQLAAREALNALMGLSGPLGAKWTVRPELDAPEPVDSLVAQAEQRAIDKSLDLELSRRRLRAAAERVDLARVEGWVPEVSAGVSAERDSDWGVGPLVQVEVPLLYQGQGETAVAASEARRERRLLADTQVRIRAQARATSSRLKTAAAGASYYETTVLPLRQQVLQQTQAEYNAMSVGVFQLLQAKREQISAAQAYVDLLHDYWIQRSQLEQLLAGRLPPGRGADDLPARGEGAMASGQQGH